MSDESEDPQAAEASPSEPALEVPARRRRGEEEDDEGGSRKGLLLVVGLVMAAAAIVAVVLIGMQDKGMYSKPVDQLVAEKAKFLGKPVRAEGNLVHGSLVKQDSPCEYRFSIEKNGVEVPVRFPKCVVPDTFRDVPGMDVGVTVEGELKADNTIEASNVLAKCPSKYEMKEKAAKGEKMPHAGVAPQNL
ncbi:MAG: cytochrome c maturation protein CcmE [Labilithrix sp.]|nr:cytochrome c maturation protein CcmE [Labilithrix sp.]